MADIENESLKWLDNLADLSNFLKKHPSATNSELALELGIHRGSVITLKALRPLLDPSAIHKIRQAAKREYPYTLYNLSFNRAECLAGLDRKVSDNPKLVHEVLDKVIARFMIPLQIKAFVNHVNSGKPIEDFNHTQIKRKTRSDKKSRIQSNGPVSEPKKKEVKDNQQDSPSDAVAGCLAILFIIGLLWIGVSCVKHLCCNSQASSAASSTPAVSSSSSSP